MPGDRSDGFGPFAPSPGPATVAAGIYREAFMHRVDAAAAVATLLVAFASSASAQTVTAYEGARLIVGDGSVIQSGTLVVSGDRITAAGANVQVPAGAARVNLAGKTVMPMMVDTHVHLSPTRERLIVDLKRRAYYGVGAVLSMGADLYPMLPLRHENIPGAARYLSAGRGITMPEPGRMTAPHWINTEAEAVKAVQELVDHKVDMVKIWVDDWRGKYKKLTPEIYSAIIKEAHAKGLRVSAHIFEMEDAKG
jgi:imidazolonepropionase-like amidohydrolase